MSPQAVKTSEHVKRGRSTATMSRREPDDPRIRKVQLLFHRKLQERRLYMEELKELRDDKYRDVYKEIRHSIGPTWYQVLSSRQQRALNTLRQCIHQGLLEGRVAHTMRVIDVLGIHPVPHAVDVFNCMESSHRDSMEFLSRLFYNIYEHDFASKRHEYDYNGRMLLSSIYYLGLPGLKKILEYQFWPDREWPVTPPEPKRRPPPLHPSPYMRPLVATLYDPQPPRRKRPPPLPDLSFLDKPFEDVPPRPRPARPPPPPPPPKKTVPLPYCYALADYRPIHLDPKWKTYNQIKGLDSSPSLKKSGNFKRKRSSKMGLVIEKKVYGLGDFLPPIKKKRHRKPPPKTGLENEQFTIQGVYLHKDKVYYIIGNLVIMPLNGYIIHGGIVLSKGQTIMLHMGLRLPVPPQQVVTPCTCLDIYGTAISYVKKTKCYCEHLFDYTSTGQLFEGDEEDPYFKKPTNRGPYTFNYEAIFETDHKQVRQEMNMIHEEDSVLIMVNPDEKDPDKIAASKKKQKKKESKMHKEPLPTCLGDTPKIQDYLRCALRQVRRLNIAARLPEIYLTRDLNEWMRKRIYGPRTREQRENSVTGATTRFRYLSSFEKLGLGTTKIYPFPASFSKLTTWARKDELKREMEQFKQRYRIKVYKAHANFNNIFWACMDMAEYPDKKFREIFWSYTIGRVSEVVLNHPYMPVETAAMYTRNLKRRYRCLAKGVEDVE